MSRFSSDFDLNNDKTEFLNLVSCGDYKGVSQFITENRSKDYWCHVINAMRIGRGDGVSIALDRNDFRLAFLLVENGCCGNEGVRGQDVISKIMKKREDSSYYHPASTLLVKLLVRGGFSSYEGKHEVYVARLRDDIKSGVIEEPKSYDDQVLPMSEVCVDCCRAFLDGVRSLVGGIGGRRG